MLQRCVAHRRADFGSENANQKRKFLKCSSGPILAIRDLSNFATRRERAKSSARSCRREQLRSFVIAVVVNESLMMEEAGRDNDDQISPEEFLRVMKRRNGGPIDELSSEDE